MFWRRKRIYLDAAAATPLSKSAHKELVRLLGLYGNPSALHKEARAAKDELDAARQKTAGAIGAHEDEMVFTSGGTEANNLAIVGVLRPLLRIHKRVHAVTCVIEHASVLEPLRALVQEGLLLTELPVDSAGRISVKDFTEAVGDETVFVSIQCVNSEIGTVQPIKEIAKEVRRARKARLDKSDLSNLPLYFHTDASQAPLWKTVATEKLGVDLMTLDGQKILGPKGVGALYVRRGVAVKPQQKGGGQEGGLRSGTENVPLAGAFAVALVEAQISEDMYAKKIAAVRNRLLKEILQRLPVAVVVGAVGGERVANNLNIAIPGLDGEMAVIALDALGVAASTRSACDQSDEVPSPVLVALKLSPAVIKGAIRFTLLPSATEGEMARAAAALAEVAQRYNSMS